MLYTNFFFLGAESRMLSFAGAPNGPESSPQVPSPERTETSGESSEKAPSLETDVEVTQKIEMTIDGETTKLSDVTLRMDAADQALKQPEEAIKGIKHQPTYNPQKVREQANRRDNFERASGILRHQKDMALVIEREKAEGALEAEKAMHRAKKNSLEDARESQAYKAERKAESGYLTDETNQDADPDRAMESKSRSAYLKSKVETLDHNSVEEYETYSEQMEKYRDTLSHIHIHPSHDAVSFDAEAKATFGLDDADVMSIDEWNLIGVSSTPLVAGNNTGSPNAPSARQEGDHFEQNMRRMARGENTLAPEPLEYDEGNIVQEFIAKDPKAVMEKIQKKMESLQEGGKILYTKEKMMINDAEHDDIPQSVEQVLDQATLTDNGEWKFEHGKEALTFIRNYTTSVEGDDFLDAEEKSWGIPGLEIDRASEDGTKIQEQERIAAFKKIVDDMGAGDQWAQIEPLLRECTVPIKSPDRDNPLEVTQYNDRTNASYKVREKIFEFLYATPQNPEVQRAKKMTEDLQAFQNMEARFLATPINFSDQDSIKKYNAEEASYKNRIATLSEDYSELGIDTNRLAYRQDRSPVDTASLITKAEQILYNSIKNPIAKKGGQDTLDARAKYKKIGDAISAISSSRSLQKYIQERYQADKKQPSRRVQLQTLLLGKEEEIKKNGGSLILNNKEMDMFRAVVQRRATQEGRVYRKRVHDVGSDGNTFDDPARMAKADTSRILIPYRAEALTADIDAWSTAHLTTQESEDGAETIPMTPSARTGALETLDELRNSVKKHLHDSQGEGLPDAYNEKISTVDKLIGQTSTLSKSADELTPEDEATFKKNLEEASAVLTELVEENNKVVPRKFDEEKLKNTFDTITDDNFVTLPELEADLEALRTERSALGEKEDSPEIKVLEEIIKTARIAGATDDKKPMKAATMKPANITFNRHGDVGIHKSNAKDLLEKVHAERVVIGKFADVEMMALSQAQCPLTINDTSITPYQAQALRSYTGPNAVLTLPNITNISKEAIEYLAQTHCHIGLRITHSDAMTDQNIEGIIIALKKVDNPNHSIEIVLPAGTEISDWMMKNYEALAELNKWRNKTVTLVDQGAKRIFPEGHIPEAAETTPEVK